MLIRTKDKEAIIAIANNIFSSPVEIWAYGSRVNGDAHETSDLDLAVYTEGKLDLNEFWDFKEALEDSTIPILIDVMPWHEIPESFRENIKKKYEVLAQISPVKA